jgi:hypothetical protein
MFLPGSIHLRRHSRLSWMPAVLLPTVLAIAVIFCTAAGNITAALVFAATGLALSAAKWRVSTRAC